MSSPNAQQPRYAIPLAHRLDNVTYEIRGALADRASKMSQQGVDILALNTGNPAAFGFDVPAEALEIMRDTLPISHAYTDSKGTIAARQAVVDRYAAIPDFPPLDVDDIFLGNGASELIQMTTQAMLNPGDEVLVPMPDYPLWSASVNMSNGKAVHYLCDENDEWNPSLEDIRSKINDRTRAIVVINPNNPTGAVYSREILVGIANIAREHSLMVLSDEIYDRILYDGNEHISMAALAPDVLTLTYNGLSKAYRACGYRAGWMTITGPKEGAKGFIDGLNLLAGMRLCPNFPGQQATIGALGGFQDIFDMTRDGRLVAQRDATFAGLSAIPEIDVVKPKGALYAFPRINPEKLEIRDDAQLMMDILEKEKILLVSGTGFNWHKPGYFRVVMLPYPDEITVALERLGNFLSSYKQ
ncbi:pyridoxal phosphate-dependent aminotransferase [Corynebacterium caspium]|uniref:pyridoxal phosphate-dependent aminotransferase n=1 Tax=Corynebacterium caspium TaxID=234828 RepID=UPI0003725F8A|nr:pyridoxal phosphate-dependent aminotransferase [Corynebacterium caspium]WKD58615.1 Glutamate-pyruvate aminotransferase AlaA [Corynebacterium caspium DSM 44850]